MAKMRMKRQCYESVCRLLCPWSAIINLFLTSISDAVTAVHAHLRKCQAYDDYFMLNKDAMGRIRFSVYQKCMTAMRMLVCGTTANSWDGYLQISESTCLMAMVRFVIALVKVFGMGYLREPTNEEHQGSWHLKNQEGFQVCSEL